MIRTLRRLATDWEAIAICAAIILAWAIRNYDFVWPKTEDLIVIGLGVVLLLFTLGVTISERRAGMPWTIDYTDRAGIKRTVKGTRLSVSFKPKGNPELTKTVQLGRNTSVGEGTLSIYVYGEVDCDHELVPWELRVQSVVVS